MSSTDVYRLAVPTGQVVFGFTLLALLSLCFAGLLVLALVRAEGGMHVPLTVFVCAGLGCNWYVLLGIPYEIRFHEPDQLSFIALRGATTLSIAKLQSIRPHRRAGGFYVLRHQDGKIRLFAQITGFHEAITRIKSANPNFEVVGI
jgi:hypothetical protein